MWSSHCFGLFYQRTSWPVMRVILQKLSLPLASLLRLFFPSVLSLLPAIHLSFLSLLWITGTVRWESCPNTFVLPKQSNTDPPLLVCSLSVHVCVCSERLRRSHGGVTRGPAGQLVLIASRGLFSGGRLVSLAAQMWGEQGISPQETSKLRPTGETDGRHRHIQAILTHNASFFFHFLHT